LGVSDRTSGHLIRRFDQGVSNNARDFWDGGSFNPTTDFDGGGRNGFGLDLLDNRSLIAVPPKSTRLGERSTDYTLDSGEKLGRFLEYKIDNPYLLFPEDKLIIGWQLPFLWTLFIASVSSSNALSITFHPGDSKLVLYGSYLSEENAVNDTSTQVLNSNAIHEAIE
jgi:hypothetical protein